MMMLTVTVVVVTVMVLEGMAMVVMKEGVDGGELMGDDGITKHMNGILT